MITTNNSLLDQLTPQRRLTRGALAAIRRMFATGLVAPNGPGTDDLYQRVQAIALQASSPATPENELKRKVRACAAALAMLHAGQNPSPTNPTRN